MTEMDPTECYQSDGRRAVPVLDRHNGLFGGSETVVGVAHLQETPPTDVHCAFATGNVHLTGRVALISIPHSSKEEDNPMRRDRMHDLLSS